MEIKEQDIQPQIEVSPLYNVFLHNDDINEYNYVIISVMKAVGHPQPVVEKIVEEAHKNGLSVVTTCSLEHAEVYRDRLTSFGLTSSIEPVSG